MTVGWTGAFAGLANWPPDHAGQGWSNFVSAAATLFTRERDGDFMASGLWRELGGNLNFFLAESRQQIWQDDFVGSVAGAVDPTYVHIVNDWTSPNAVYAVTVPIPLIPNIVRGPDAPPRLKVKIRHRRNGGAAAGKIARVYGVSSLPAALTQWTGLGANTGDIAAPAAYPADPGWSAEYDLTPDVIWQTWRHPELVAGEGAQEVRVPWTVLVIAGVGDGVNGPLVAAIQVREEVVAA